MTPSLRFPPPDIQQNFIEVKSLMAVQGRDITLRLLKKADFIPERSQITSVSVVPFMPGGKIVAVNLQRGLDIPGGHVEANDGNLINTIQREAYEEACIRLTEPLTVVGIIESNYNPKCTTYMLIFTGQVSKMSDFDANFESTSREIVTTHVFLNRYSAGPKDMMSELLKRAEAVAPELPPYSTHRPSSLYT